MNKLSNNNRSSSRPFSRGELKGGANTEVVRLQVFDGTTSNVLGFVIVYKLYIKMKMREAAIEKQIQ